MRLRYTDHFGNEVHYFDVIQSHQKMIVAAASEVLTDVPPTRGVFKGNAKEKMDVKVSVQAF